MPAEIEKISAIVPCYNVDKYLRKSVDSIINQTYHNMEIILVDDGSTDTTGRLCDELAQLDSRIRVIHKANGGLSDARNAGLDIAEGDFYSFIDGDDYLEPDAYELMIGEMKEPSVSLVAAGIITEDLEGNKRVRMSEKRMCLTKEEALLNLFSADRTISQSSCNKLFRKNLFNDLRYKKGIINEDMQILPSILHACNLVILLNKPVYHYVNRTGSITVSQFSLWKFQGVETIYESVMFCKRYYSSLVPYANFYALDLFYKTYIELLNSSNRKDFRKQEHTLRRKMLSKYTLCVASPNIRKEYGHKIKSIAITAFFGKELTDKLVETKQKIFK